MKRINIVYGGITYSVGDRDLHELQQEIAAGVQSGDPFWLTVNQGEGTPRDALLMISTGTDLALLPIPEPDQRPEHTTEEKPPPPAR